LYRRLGGPQSRSGQHGEVKIPDPTGTRTPTLYIYNKNNNKWTRHSVSIKEVFFHVYMQSINWFAFGVS
jgi:hypothetical protein